MHNVIIMKAIISLIIIVGAIVVVVLYDKTKPGDLVEKNKIKYSSSLWLGDNSGLFGALVILWLPTLLFYALLSVFNAGGPEAAGLGATVALWTIYIGLSVSLIVITVVMTILMRKARNADRVDKLSYISQIFVGSHSGLLKNLFLLWSPFILMIMIQEPFQALSPFKGGIMAAAKNLGSHLGDLRDVLPRQHSGGSSYSNNSNNSGVGGYNPVERFFRR